MTPNPGHELVHELGHGTAPAGTAAAPRPSRAGALWSRLRARDPALGETPPATDDMPWYLAALLGASAWIAAGFLFGFVYQLLRDRQDEALPVGTVGALCCLLALGLMRVRHGRAFAEQFGTACSLVGQVVCSFASYLLLREAMPFPNQLPQPLSWVVLAMIAAAMAALGPPPLHRFLSAGLAALALTAALNDRQLPLLQYTAPPLLAVTSLWLWLRIVRSGDAATRAQRVLPPVAWAFSLVALCMIWIGIESLGWGWLDTAYADQKRLAQWFAALTVVALLPVCVALLTRGSALRWRWTGAAAVLALLLAGAPGVAFGLMLALLGFALHRPALLGLGLLGLAVYLVRYYFQLDVPLLQKSGWLLAGGAALLLARMASRRMAKETTA